MAETKTFLSLTGLQNYDDKIKAWVSDRDDLFDVAGAAATVQGNLDEEVTRAQAAEGANATAAANAQTAAEAAQAAADQAQSEVDALEGYVGTIPSTSGVSSVIAYIDKKTEGIATDAALAQIQNDLDAAEAEIAGIKADYLVGADKTELAADIAENADAIAILNGTDAGSVAKQVADAVASEKSARETAVAGVQGEVDALEQTHATDKAALENAIAEAKAAGTGAQTHSEGVATDLAEYQTANDAAVKAISDDYLKSTDKTGLQGLIDAEASRADTAEKANAAAITAEKARAEGAENGLNTRLTEVETFFTTAEGETLDAALDTLVEIQKYITDEGAAADQMVKDIAANTTAITAEQERAEGVEAGLNTRLEAVEAMLGEGEGTVDDKIADVQGEVDALEQTHATDKAALEAADEAISGRLDALEAIDHEHANATVLNGITAEQVTAWDAAEGEIDALQAEVASFIAITTAEIDALFA